MGQGWAFLPEGEETGHEWVQMLCTGEVTTEQGCWGRDTQDAPARAGLSTGVPIPAPPV